MPRRTTRTRSGARHVAAILLLCGASFPVPSIAQTQPAAASAADAALRKPTDFRSRAELRYEYQSLPDDGERQLFIPRLEYAVTPSLALRLELPYQAFAPGSGDAVDGVGDALGRIAWRAVTREGFALILVTEVTFDTASNERLGLGTTVVSPLVYAAIDMPRFNSVFFPNVQHYFSVGGDAGRASVSQTALKPNLLTRWPDRYYTFLEPTFLVDWKRDATMGLAVELEVGKLLGKNWALWGRPGIGVIRNGLPQIYRWNIEAGVRYIF